MDLLQTVAVFLGTTLVMVPLLKRLGLASVIGYLATGVLLGPQVLDLLNDPHVLLKFAEYGIVLLLFLIGIELEPSRLWLLRRSVFGLGALQVLLTGLVLTGLLLWIDLRPAVAVIVGFGLALSSTAFALQLLSEKGQLNTHHGRSAFAVLLFQDIAVIPLLALIPLLGGKSTGYGWDDLGKALVVVGLFLLSSRVLVRPALRYVAAAGTPEVFTAAALFLVCGAGLLTEFLGMSMSLGAFAAGVLLADSEYRHEIEASLLPIKGMLLGLFFIAVGMTADIHLLHTETGIIVGSVLAMMVIKALVLVGIGRLTGHSLHTSVQMGLPLAQGGEFAFVLFSTAAAEALFSESFAQRLILIVTLSMALTPFAFMLLEKVIEPRLRPRDSRAFDQVPEDHETPVVIAGFGRFGQIVARVLRMHRIGFTALESDPRQATHERKLIAIRTKAALARKKARGEPMGTKITVCKNGLPYKGKENLSRVEYKIAGANAMKEKAKANPENKKSYELAISLKQQGYTLQAISEKLNKANVTSTGGKWHKGSVSRLLKRHSVG